MKLKKEMTIEEFAKTFDINDFDSVWFEVDGKGVYLTNNELRGCNLLRSWDYDKYIVESFEVYQYDLEMKGRRA